jgi:hypothetical protein
MNTTGRAMMDMDGNCTCGLRYCPQCDTMESPCEKCNEQEAKCYIDGIGALCLDCREAA